MHRTPFALHPQLAADSLPVIALTLCDVLLIDDCRYWWCVLVPRLADLRDLHDVPAEHKAQLHREMDIVSVALLEQAMAHKMNVAALGNMVEQLHIHIVARHRADAAWPGPIWGVGKTKPYTQEQAQTRIEALRDRLT